MSAAYWESDIQTSVQVPDELARLDLLAARKDAASPQTPEELTPGGPEVAAPSAKVELKVMTIC